LVVAPESGEVLTACANGFGKRTSVDSFPTKGRGGKGMIAVKTSERNGELVGAVAVNDSNELLLISDGGTMVRTRVSEIRSVGRNAQGVMLIRVGDSETLVGVVCLDGIEDDDAIEGVASEVDADGAESPVEVVAEVATIDSEEAAQEPEAE
jgi:DNA gyrase subunit A